MKEKLQQYLHKLIEVNGSDLHLKAGSSVHMRVNGELLAVKDENLNNEDLLNVAEIILSTPQYNALIEDRELDCSYNLDETKRFRVNFFFQVNGLSVVLRVIPNKILSIE